MSSFEYVPEGMRIADYEKHPVRQMLRLAGCDGLRAVPTNAELDQLRLSAADRAKVAAACERVGALRDNPNREVSSRAEAERLAGEIIAGLPEHQRNPRHFGRLDDVDLSTLSPAELAARVPKERWAR